MYSKATFITFITIWKCGLWHLCTRNLSSFMVNTPTFPWPRSAFTLSLLIFPISSAFWDIIFGREIFGRQSKLFTGCQFLGGNCGWCFGNLILHWKRKCNYTYLSTFCFSPFPTLPSMNLFLCLNQNFGKICQFVEWIQLFPFFLNSQ